MIVLQVGRFLKISTKQIIITCEHGGNQVPAEYRYIFKNKKLVLQSHRGYDAGALQVAKNISETIKAPLIFSETSRLLIDLNRSLHHHHLFSEFTRGCNKIIKAEILDKYYLPYRNRVEKKIRYISQSGRPVIHFSIHTFTPKLRNEIRNSDIGLLYDPARGKETALCKTLQLIMKNTSTPLIIRRNYPYQGKADGFTTYLRKQFSQSKYLGVEIEINQKHFNSTKNWTHINNHVMNSIMQLIRQTV